MGHAIATQILIEAGFALPTEIGVVHFTAGSAGSPIVLDFDSIPYVSGLSTANSHYGVQGVSYNLNQGDGFQFATSVIAPLTLLSLRESNDPFSPDGDNYKDKTNITATFNRSASWKLMIKDSIGKTVRSFAGRGAKVSVLWDGKNSKGAVVPNGVYTYTLNAIDSGGGSVSASSTVTVGRTPRTRTTRR